MPDAFIYDHVRTPRGRGKVDGALHEVTALDLASQALGHPLGATGAMILGTALDELERRGLSTALITLCIGAGMGTATIIERV
jgi:acetyl-CoA C-acetyltransferase